MVATRVNAMISLQQSDKQFESCMLSNIYTSFLFAL